MFLKKENKAEDISGFCWCFARAFATVFCWQVKGPMTLQCNIIFRWILLPLVLLIETIIVAKNNYWGKGNWLCVLVAAITYLTVPYTKFVEVSGNAAYTFVFPNFGYMIIGIFIAICGIGIASFWNKRVK